MPSAANKKQSSTKQSSDFIKKFTRILDEQEQAHIISWSNKGNAIHVRDKASFCDIILPILIESKSYVQFVKYMKQYKFKQIKRKDGSEYFYKKLFHRNLVSQNVRGNNMVAATRLVVTTAPKKDNPELASKKMNDTSERVSAQIDMKKMNFFQSGSV